MARTTWADVERALALRPAKRVPEAVGSRAAVALVLREAAGLELLFIRRAEHPHDPWSGQMAFPGGRSEKHDGELARTAVRETREEIGLDLDSAADPLGPLDEVRAMSRMQPLDLSIQPFVFRLRQLPGLLLSEEVRSIHWVPLDHLRDPTLRGELEYPFEGRLLRFACFRVDGQTIWGLTLRMFSNLQALLDDAARPGTPG